MNLFDNYNTSVYRASGRLVFVLVLLFSLLAYSCTGDQQRPNILVIIADDAGWNDVGYHGSEIATPNIDSLAKNGVELNRFYVAPTCSPSRAAFLTGMPASRIGIVAPISGTSEKTLPDSVTTLPEILHRAGYETALIGKWHLGLQPQNGPNAYGFEYSYGFLHGQIDQYAHTYKNGDQSWHINGHFMEEEGHATDLITQETIRWLTEKRDTSQPFFVQVSYSVPHVPLQEEEKWKEMYNETISDSARLAYAASMTHMDIGIGQIVEALEKTELDQSTLVLFMSDNGAQKDWYPDQQYDGKYGPYAILGSNAPLKGWKTSNYEGGIRVPAVIYWKNNHDSVKIDHPVSITDLMPTFLEIAGIDEHPRQMEGKSILNLIYGDSNEPSDSIYVRGHLQESLITQKWKLIRTRHQENQTEYELYQIEQDPEEKQNVVEKYPEIASELQQKLEQEFLKDADWVNYTIN